MPKVSRASAKLETFGPVEDRHADVNGYTINFVSFAEDVDGTPLLRGLPDDRCQCPHWGYVVKGTATFRFADRDEVFEAGDAFYVEPGHSPIHAAESEVLIFSPAEELKATEDAMRRNMQAMEGG